jgi:hypothetical protein
LEASKNKQRGNTTSGISELEVLKINKEKEEDFNVIKKNEKMGRSSIGVSTIR